MEAEEKLKKIERLLNVIRPKTPQTVLMAFEIRRILNPNHLEEPVDNLLKERGQVIE